MRNPILFFSIWLLFLSGCGVIYNTPFPGSGKVLSKIPAAMQGNWTSNEVNVSISETAFVVKDDNGSGKHFRYTLGENCELKEQENRYVLSMVDTSNAGYRVLFIENYQGELLIYDIDLSDYELYNYDNNLPAVESKDYYTNLIDSTIVSVYSPTTEQWKALESYQVLRITLTRE